MLEMKTHLPIWKVYDGWSMIKQFYTDANPWEEGATVPNRLLYPPGAEGCCSYSNAIIQYWCCYGFYASKNLAVSMMFSKGSALTQQLNVPG